MSSPQVDKTIFFRSLQQEQQSNHNHNIQLKFIDAHLLASFATTVTQLCSQHRHHRDTNQKQSHLLNIFLLFLNDPTNDPIQQSLVHHLDKQQEGQFLLRTNGEDDGDDPHLYFMLHFCAVLCLLLTIKQQQQLQQLQQFHDKSSEKRERLSVLNRLLLLDYQIFSNHKLAIKDKQTRSQQLSLLPIHNQAMATKQKKKSFLSHFQLRQKVKRFIILRMYHHINYSIVRFMVGVFGSRLAPMYLSKLLSLLFRRHHEEKKKIGGIELWQWKAYGGFVIGTLFGAMSSALPLTVTRQLKNQFLMPETSSRSLPTDSMKANDIPLTMARQSFWLMVGSFVGIVMNFGARYGAHRAVLYFLKSQLPSTLLSKHPMLGSDAGMNRMILKTVTGMYQGYVDSLLYPQIPKNLIETSDKSSMDKQQKQKKKGGKKSGGMDLGMMASMMGLDREAILSQIPLYKDSRIARALINRYLPFGSQEKKKPQPGYLSNVPVLSKISNSAVDTYRWSQNQIARVSPSDNPSWHNLSARTALWFSDRFTKYDSTGSVNSTTNALLHQQLESLMNQAGKILHHSNTVQWSSRL